MEHAWGCSWFLVLFFHISINNKGVFYIWLCANDVCGYGLVHMSAIPTEFGRILDLLEFKTFMSSLAFVLGTKLRTSGQAAIALNA